MIIAQNLLGMSNCCVVDLVCPGLIYTSVQPQEDLQKQLPDYSGTIAGNVAICKMIDELARQESGSVSFLCFIKTTLSSGWKAGDHAVLVSIIKEGPLVSMRCLDSNNESLQNVLGFQEHIELIRDTYAARLLP